MTTPIESPPAPPVSKFGPLAFAGIAVGIVLAIVRALIWSGGASPAEALGYAVGAALLPALIAYAIAGRRKVRNPTRFSLWLMGLSVLLFLLALANRPESVAERTRRIALEAAGTQAVKKVGTRGDQEWDSLLRDVIADVLDRRKLYEQRIAELEPDIKLLGSASSFSSRSTILHSMDVTRKCLAEDLSFSRETEAWPERTKARLDASSLSNEDRQQFMSSFREVFENSKLLATHREAVKVESEWGDATLDLYSFALKNRSKLTVRGSQLVISDERTRTQFNQKLERYETLRKSMVDLNDQLEQLRQETLKKGGLTLQDLGMKRPN